MKTLWQRFRGWYLYTAAGVMIDSTIATFVLVAVFALLAWLSK